MIRTIAVVGGIVVLLIAIWVISRGNKKEFPTQVSPGPNSFAVAEPYGNSYRSAESDKALSIRESEVPNPQEGTAGESTERPRAPEGDSVVAAVRAASMLEVAAESFLSAVPDFSGFEGAVSLLATVVTVDPDSVLKNPEDGSVQGTLVVPGGNVEASFRIQGSRYEIKLEPSPGIPLPAPFGSRSIAVSFLNIDGNAERISAMIQYHPSPRKYEISTVPVGTESYVGWDFQASPNGTSGSPISVKRSPDGQAWIVGTSSLPTISTSGYNAGPYAAWLSKLSPFAP